MENLRFELLSNPNCLKFRINVYPSRRGEELAAFANIEEMKSKSRRYTFLYLRSFFVTPFYRGWGFGTSLIEEVNKFIKQKEKMGLLINTAFSSVDVYNWNTKKILDMSEFYSRHGWVYCKDLLKPFPKNADDRFMFFNGANISAENFLKDVFLFFDGPEDLHQEID